MSRYLFFSGTASVLSRGMPSASQWPEQTVRIKADAGAVLLCRSQPSPAAKIQTGLLSMLCCLPLFLFLSPSLGQTMVLMWHILAGRGGRLSLSHSCIPLPRTSSARVLNETKPSET
ncbi:hypothetical protein LY78DRAFT_81675 [Colletotrichum sublineola]|nr:hypothetical protein LY78DRAFT_81675 [Colletotrichum sublineola]